MGIEKNINDYSTFSMDIFFDSTSALENAAKVLSDSNNKFNELADKVNGLENLFLTSVQQENLNIRVDELEVAIENASLNFENSGSVLDLISATNIRINQIINGEIPTEVQYNTDVIVPGDGIAVDNSIENKVKIHNKNYGYVLNEVYNYDINTNVVLDAINAGNEYNPALAIDKGIWTTVKKYTNLVRIYLNDQDVFQNDLNIYLDDSVNSFKEGQVIKLVFRKGFYKFHEQINIYTDVNNGWVLKKTINSSDLISSKPYVELICVDETNKTFELDIIR